MFFKVSLSKSFIKGSAKCGLREEPIVKPDFLIKIIGGELNKINLLTSKGTRKEPWGIFLVKSSVFKLK